MHMFNMALSFTKPINFSFSIGFYLTITSAILFVIGFTIKTEIFSKELNDKELLEIENEALELLTKRYVKG